MDFKVSNLPKGETVEIALTYFFFNQYDDDFMKFTIPLSLFKGFNSKYVRTEITVKFLSAMNFQEIKAPELF